jgi:peroxiredoxin Q/BCP
MLTVLSAVIVAILSLLGIAAVRAAHDRTKAPIPGTPAPGFTLNAQDGKPVSLSDFRGHWVVLYFYPKDFTSGCTKEARNFQHDLALYEQRNAVILGVSGQDEVSHEKFCAAEGLHFRLLADPHCELSERYGSVVNLGVARLSARHTFLIDPAGVIRKVYVKVDPAKHSAEVLADLSELQKTSPQS